MNEVILKKKILNYTKNRGLKEVEIILEYFTNKFLYSLNTRQLNDFFELLQENDADIFDWIIVKQLPPLKFRTNDILKQLINIYNGRQCNFK